MEEKEEKNEEEKTEGAKEEGTTGKPDEGSKYETTPVIERAREEREKMEAATKAMREENDRREQIMAKKALGGEAEAGQPPEKPAEITDKEYAQKALAGEYNDKK